MLAGSAVWLDILAGCSFLLCRFVMLLPGSAGYDVCLAMLAMLTG